MQHIASTNFCRFTKTSFMPDYIIKTKNKREEKVVKAFLSSLDIDFYTEAQEEEALYKKMTRDQQTRKLNETEKEDFIKQMKSAK